MKLVSSLSIFLSVISLCRAQCGSQNDQTPPMFNNILDGINLINSCDFPTNKFNASCVSVSCNQLTASGLCPYTSTGSLDQSALTKILSILNSCFQQQNNICDTPTNNIPFPPVAVSLSQLFGSLPITGQCSKAPNSGTITNVQNVSFAIDPAQSFTSDPLNVIVSAPGITMTGDILCTITFNISDTTPTTFNLPNISYILKLGLTPTAAIDFSNSQPIVQVQADNITVNFQVGNFVASGPSSQLPAGVQSLFTSGVTALFKSSGNPTAVANFYSTFIAFGIEATKGNCPSQ